MGKQLTKKADERPEAKENWTDDQLPHIFAHAGAFGTYCGPGRPHKRCRYGKRSNSRHQTVTVKGGRQGYDSPDDALAGTLWSIDSYNTRMGALYIEADNKVEREGQFNGLRRLYVVNDGKYSMTTTRLQSGIVSAIPDRDVHNWMPVAKPEDGMYFAVVPFQPCDEPKNTQNKLERAIVEKAQAVEELQQAKPKKPAQLQKAINEFHSMLRSLQVINQFTGANKRGYSEDREVWLKFGAKLSRQAAAEEIKSIQRLMGYQVDYIVEYMEKAEARLKLDFDDAYRNYDRIGDCQAEYARLAQRLTPKQLEKAPKLPPTDKIEKVTALVRREATKVIQKWLNEVADDHALWRAWKVDVRPGIPTADAGVYRGLRLRTPFGNTYDLVRIKRKGSRFLLETSRGVELVLARDELLGALSLARDIREKNWHGDQLKGYKVGEYSIERLEGQDGVTVGCHRIHALELDFLAANVKELLREKAK